MSPLWSVFFPPRYIRYMVLFSKEAMPLWDYEVWAKSVAPILDRYLFTQRSSPPSVHSNQVLRNKDKSVRFGRISWSDKGHQKWCHNSPVTTDRCGEWDFVETQLFWPSRAVLIQLNDIPQMFLQVAPSTCHLYGQAASLYHSSLHIVIRHAFARIHKMDLKALVRELDKSLSPVAIYRTQSRVGSLNVFESLKREDFTYPRSCDDPLPVPYKMRGRWSRLDSNDLGEAGKRRT